MGTRRASQAGVARPHAARPELAPQEFLQLAGHPLRWRVLEELTRSDRTVQELTGLVGEAQNLVSYHLAKLRGAGLVRGRRSSADGRDSYYSADLARIGELFSATTGALHPGLAVPRPERAAGRAAPVRILFLCTGNSARSQMAEALARHRSRGSVHACSAGSHPKPLHPLAVRVMRDEYGIDLSRSEAKHLNVFADRRFDWVISLCDRVREVCPEFPGSPEAVHWSIPEPGGEAGYRTFQETAAELDTRVQFLLALLTNDSLLTNHPTIPMSLTQEEL